MYVGWNELGQFASLLAASCSQLTASQSGGADQAATDLYLSRILGRTPYLEKTTNVD